VLEGVSDSLDDVSAKNIKGPRELGEKLIEVEAKRIAEVCELLGSPTPA
jgi:hypothetical protein